MLYYNRIKTLIIIAEGVSYTLKEFIKKYSHAWVFSYIILYMAWFTWLEKNVTTHYHIIESTLDRYIPFCEIFVVPYLLWFLYCFITLGYFFFTSKEDFYKAAKLTITGMTLFLIICTVFPNGQNLRPVVFARDNIFIDLVRMVYSKDTPTNVLPSIHVFNSVACYIAIAHNDRLRKHQSVQFGSLILTILIVLSTVFLKQHSIIDVVVALFMIAVIYPFAYHPEWIFKKKTAHEKQPVV